MLRALWIWGVLLASTPALGQPPQDAFPARIQRWYDGDTAYLRVVGEAPSGVAKYETVRLLGVNAPEVGEPFAEEATRYFRSLTLGKTVYVQLSPWERRDTHSRLLGYLWVETEAGWVLVNEELLKAGLTRPLVYYPERERYYCRFLHALILAQCAGLGLWQSGKEPLPLQVIEEDPVAYVTQAVTVAFEVSRVGMDSRGWSLWAAASRYGFRAVLRPMDCPNFGNWEDFDPAALVGQTLLVTGELLWDSLPGGPRIVVLFPEQIRTQEEERP